MHKPAVIVVSLAFLAAPSLWAVSHHHRRYTRHRAVKTSWVNYRAFPPTPDSLREQNEAIDKMGLPRIKDRRALESMVAAGQLVPITQSRYVRVNPKLEADRRYVRPFVNAFLQELGREYFDHFEEPIQVNSAVRTIRTQISLMHWNRNAAPVHGEKASAHLAGVAVDLQRRGLNREEMEFIQQRLLRFSSLGMVIVEEELKQPCFHVVVTGEYLWLPPMPDLESRLPNLPKEVQNGKRVFSTADECPRKSHLDGRSNPATP